MTTKHIDRRITRRLTRPLIARATNPPGFTGQLTVSDSTPDEGDTLTITWVETSSSGGSFTFQFTKGGVNLSDGGDVSGATTTELTVANVDSDDNGAYRVVVTETGSGEVRVFGPRVIVVTSTPTPSALMTYDDLEMSYNDLAMDYS